MSLVEKIITEVPTAFHDSGSLHPEVLRGLAEAHAAAKARRSVETGCGISTLLLSQLSDDHTSFVVPYGDSLQRTRSHPLLRGEVTNFVIGPTQVTLPRWQFGKPVDLVMLDGPHAYPFPELEYYFCYPHVREGGLLVVDDIHIPSVALLYHFLLADEMWTHQYDVLNTAFFRRTTAPIFNPIGDEWYLQRFNRREFPFPEHLDHVLGAGWRRREFGDAPVSAGAELARREIEATVAKLRQSLRATKDDLVRRTLQHRQAETQLDKAQTELAGLQAQVAHLRAELEAVYGSTSWRVSALLRAVGKSARQLRA